MCCLRGGDVLGGSGRFLGLVRVGCVCFSRGVCLYVTVVVGVLWVVTCVGVCCGGMNCLVFVKRFGFWVFVGVLVVGVGYWVGGCHCLWKQCFHAVSSAIMGALL